MIVVMVKTQKTGEFCGIFWGPSMEAIRQAVDEHIPPDECKYLPLEAGGVFWEDAPAKIKSDDDFERFSTPSWCEDTASELCGNAGDRKWRKLASETPATT